MDSRTGSCLYDHQPSQLFVPASITKLFTAALALDRLGPHHRLETIVLAGGRPRPDGTLDHDLLVRGQGDPGFVWNYGHTSPLRSFDPLVRLVRQAGIQHIRGGLQAEETFLGGTKYGSGWAWEDLVRPYGGALSDLNANHNRVRLHVRPGASPGQPGHVQFQPVDAGLEVLNQVRTVEPDGPRQIRWSRQPGRKEVVVSGPIPLRGPPWIAEVAVEEPALLFLELYRQALIQAKIRVEGPLTIRFPSNSPAPARTGGSWVPLGRAESAPVADLVRAMLKQSQNLYACVLLAAVGRECHRQGRHLALNTEQAAVAELRQFVREIGIPMEHVQLEEGSGLSRNNLLTPHAVTHLLRHMVQHRHAEAFVSALPVAARDGTLAERMVGTAAAGRVRAKTGTLRWAHGLAGYVQPDGRRPLTFCVFLNRYAAGADAPSAQVAIDTLTLRLIEWATEAAP